MKNGQYRETGNIGYTRRIKTKQKHNIICVGNYYMQTNTNNVTLSWPRMTILVTLSAFWSTMFSTKFSMGVIIWLMHTGARKCIWGMSLVFVVSIPVTVGYVEYPIPARFWGKWHKTITNKGKRKSTY